jgi:hypothetical protein
MATTVVALRNIISSFRDVGNRDKGERFTCADWLAHELAAAGEVRIEGGTPNPKAERASPAGRPASQSSSRQAPASPKAKSKK